MISLLKKIYRKSKKTINSNNISPQKIEVSYEQKREIIDSFRKKFKSRTLVETGTFLGDTIFYFKNKFENLYSIELSHDLAERAKQRFSNDDHIKIIQGDSGFALSELQKCLNEKTLYWLDGHYSSDFFYKDEYFVTAKSDKNTPIESELDILLSAENLNVILIDDARLFIGREDYPTIDMIKKKVKKSRKNYKVHVQNDIICILPGAY